MIYLDNAATTFPKPENVYRAMDKMNREGAVNAGRGSYKLAQEASKIIADTKSKIRQLVHLDTSAVVFAPSITIAINQIVNGLDLRKNAVIYVSPYEHNAVARSIYALSKKMKFTVKELPVNDIFESFSLLSIVSGTFHNFSKYSVTLFLFQGLFTIQSITANTLLSFFSLPVKHASRIANISELFIH